MVGVPAAPPAGNVGFFLPSPKTGCSLSHTIFFLLRKFKKVQDWFRTCLLARRNIDDVVPADEHLAKD